MGENLVIRDIEKVDWLHRNLEARRDDKRSWPHPYRMDPKFGSLPPDASVIFRQWAAEEGRGLPVLLHNTVCSDLSQRGFRPDPIGSSPEARRLAENATIHTVGSMQNYWLRHPSVVAGFKVLAGYARRCRAAGDDLGWNTPLTDAEKKAVVAVYGYFLLEERVYAPEAVYRVLKPELALSYDAHDQSSINEIDALIAMVYQVHEESKDAKSPIWNLVAPAGSGNVKAVHLSDRFVKWLKDFTRNGDVFNHLGKMAGDAALDWNIEEHGTSFYALAAARSYYGLCVWKALTDIGKRLQGEGGETYLAKHDIYMVKTYPNSLRDFMDRGCIITDGERQLASHVQSKPIQDMVEYYDKHFSRPGAAWSINNHSFSLERELHRTGLSSTKHGMSP